MKTDAIRTEEVKEAIKTLENNKAVGVGQNTAELIKEGGEVSTNTIVKLLNQC